MTAPTTPERAAEARPVEVLITQAQAQILVEIGRAAAEACGLPFGPSDEVAALRAWNRDLHRRMQKAERRAFTAEADRGELKAKIDELCVDGAFMVIQRHISRENAATTRAEIAEATITQARQILTDAGCDRPSLVDGVRALVEERGRLREALKPFAEACDNAIDEDDHDRENIWESAAAIDIKVSDLRRARSALADGGQHGE